MAPFPSMKWRVIGSDLIGPFTATSEGYRYAQIVMDTFSKYAIFIPMRRQEKTTTADALFQVYEVFMYKLGWTEMLNRKQGARDAWLA